MKHIVFYSGGIGSWMTAKRVVEKHGKENVICLFTDTLIEDQDLYRFMLETTADIYGVNNDDLIKRCETMPPTSKDTQDDRKRFLTELAADATKNNSAFIWINDGRDPWDIFRDVRFLGNSRLAQCSHIIKQELSQKYIDLNFKQESCSKFIKKKDKKDKTITYWEDPEVISKLRKEWEEDERESCRLYLGIDWTEDHRRKSPEFNWAPHTVEFPMCEEPYLCKNDMIQSVEDSGIKPCRMYAQKFSHANCGGFCVRAGQGHFINLLQQNPDLYKYHEEKELELIDFLDKDVSILRRTVKGERNNLTLRQLREEYQADNTEQIDMFDIGGCGCFVNDN